LFDAIRASIAIPMVFTPFKHGQRTLLDGCLVNPLPISPTLNDATDLTVVVSLGGPAEARPLPQPNAPLVSGDGYAQRIKTFVDSSSAIARPLSPRLAFLTSPLYSTSVDGQAHRTPDPGPCSRPSRCRSAEC